MAGNDFCRLVGVLSLGDSDEFAMLAHYGGATGKREVESATDGAQNFAMLPPQRGNVPVVVALVHDG